MQITFEGKWANLRNLVTQMEEQGWSVVSCEGNETFTLTVVVLQYAG